MLKLENQNKKTVLKKIVLFLVRTVEWFIFGKIFFFLDSTPLSSLILCNKQNTIFHENVRKETKQKTKLR